MKNDAINQHYQRNFIDSPKKYPKKTAPPEGAGGETKKTYFQTSLWSEAEENKAEAQPPLKTSQDYLEAIHSVYGIHKKH